MAAPEDIPAAGGDPKRSSERDLALFRAAIEAAGEAVVITTPELDPPGPLIEYVNPAFTRMTGYAAREAIGQSPRFLQGPRTDRAVLDRMRADLAAHGSFHGEAVNYRKDGSAYVLDWRIAAIRDGTGRVSRWVAIQRDVTAQRQAEERQRFLVAELQHRVRNILAVVRSVARRTAATSQTAEDYAMHLDGRLNALARTQALATRNPFLGIDLAFLVAEELLSCAAQEGEQVNIDGPDVRLQPKAADTFGLAVHELATNAVKFGALSNPAGRIRVAWRIEGATTPERPPKLRFEWAEAGLRGLGSAPQRRGFGTELLERTLPFELGAETSLAFAPDGVRCRIALPLTERIVVSGVST